jgi:hypothetical protein
MWVRLPYLSLHCWNDKIVRAIGNSLEKYIEREKPKDGIQSCAHICFEIDLEKAFPRRSNLLWMIELTYSRGTVNNSPSSEKIVTNLGTFLRISQS